MKAIFLFAVMAVLLPLGGSTMGQNPPDSSAASDQGKKIFVSQCAKCHDADGSKKLPDGTTLLLRLSRSKDPETRLATRLKDEQQRRQVFLYLQPLIERTRAAAKEQKRAESP